MPNAEPARAPFPGPQPEKSPAGRFHVVINAGSGSARKIGEKAFKRLARDTDLDIESFDLLHAGDIPSRLEALADSPLPLLIGGGDGTIAQAAALHLRPGAKPFGILPMGTMNLLARDLGIPLVTGRENVFDLYRSTRVQAVDVGMANDQPFLCCAAVGTIPKASLLRESLREQPDVVMLPRLTAFLLSRMDRSRMLPLEMVADGREVVLNTAALVISNNRFARGDEASHKLAKSSLQDGTLGVYSAAPQSLMDRLRLLMTLHHGRLDAAPALTELQAENVMIRTGKDHELVSIDGEAMLLPTPLNFRIVKGGLKILIPCQEKAKS